MNNIEHDLNDIIAILKDHNNHLESIVNELKKLSNRGDLVKIKNPKTGKYTTVNKTKGEIE